MKSKQVMLENCLNDKSQQDRDLAMGDTSTIDEEKG
jgi:hypothetical protein